MKPKVYIAGKITGLKPEEFRYLFHEAARKLSLAGYEPVNPCTIAGKIIAENGWTWEEACKEEHKELFTKADDEELLRCSAIYMLSNYAESKGALRELQLAKEKGLFIMIECIQNGYITVTDEYGFEVYEPELCTVQKISRNSLF